MPDMPDISAQSDPRPHPDSAAQWEVASLTTTQLHVDLAVAVEEEPQCTVRLVGELDLATIAQLRDALHLVGEGRYRLVVVDMGELRFLCLAGLQLLAEARQTLQTAGCRLVLSHPAAITLRALAVTGLDQILHVVDQ